MKKNIIKRTVSLLLALVCILGVLPLSAFAATGLPSAPASITQKSSDYMKIGGKSVRYQAASSVINNIGLPFVFNEQVNVPGLDAPIRALCAYQKGTLGPAANGQKWNYKSEADSASLKVLLTYIYSLTYGDFTDAGEAAGLGHWTEYWSDIWFLVAQAGSWLYEHGAILDVNSNREGFIEQMSEEFVAAMKLYHRTYGQSSWIKDWDAINTHSIIDSNDGGKTGNSAYDYIATGVNLVLDHPEYFHDYHLWIYEWDKSQPWKLAGQSGVPMQHLLIAVPDPEPKNDIVKLTVKKLEAGTNKPIPGVTFKVEGMDENSDFSLTRETGADGTFSLTAEADDLIAGQYTITEVAAPEGYVAQTTSQTVTVLPNSSVANTFTFYNTPTTTEGDGTIRKVDSDNPTQGLPGAVIRITSVKLDEGGSFMSEYVTKDGGYVLKEDLDFSELPTGSYVAEEITPPEGFILSSDVSKVKQPFVWDGEHDISLIFENSAKVKVMLKKVDESGSPLAGAIFVILRDGQIIGTEETKEDGTITVSNVTEGYVEHWPEAFKKNVGLLLFGDVGTGKSFLAGCIANALLDRDVPVLMTNFPIILARLCGMFGADRADFLASLEDYDLLIIDDLGVERSTEYAMEQMFSVIDARYRSGKPLIVTTNLKLDEIKHPPDLAHARIYDRILERCAPILFTGKNFREENADGTKSTARKIITDSK